MTAETYRSPGYTRTAIALHWAIAAFVLLNLAIGLFHDALPRGWGAMGLHKAIGITVLALTLVRIGWRLAHPAPPLPPEVKPWERGAAHLSHFVLYALMLAMPLSGWAMVSGPERRPLTWFGLFDIPYLPVSAAASDTGHEAHELLGWVMLALVALHVAAALRHHFLLRDAVLARMTPGVTPPPGAGVVANP